MGARTNTAAKFSNAEVTLLQVETQPVLHMLTVADSGPGSAALADVQEVAARAVAVQEAGHRGGADRRRATGAGRPAADPQRQGPRRGGVRRLAQRRAGQRAADPPADPRRRRDRARARRDRRLPRRARAHVARQAAGAGGAQGGRGRLLQPDQGRLRRRARPARTAFDDMQRQLARLDTARKQFIASASHELRTPIFSLGGFLELLEDEELDEETRAQFLSQLRGQVARMRKLATELLDLSRLESGALELRPEPTDVGQLAREVASEVHPRDRDARGRPGGPRGARADRDRLRSRARRAGDADPARQRARAHAGGHDHRRFGRAREWACHPGGRRLGSRHPPPDHAAHLRALLHLSGRRARRRPRPRDRARAGGPDERGADGALGPGQTAFKLTLPA